MGLDPSCFEGKMVWQEFTPKTWEETDVDIKISHCGICGSDLHTLRSGWVNSSSGEISNTTNFCNRAQLYTLAASAMSLSVRLSRSEAKSSISRSETVVVLVPSLPLA